MVYDFMRQGGLFRGYRETNPTNRPSNIVADEEGFGLTIFPVGQTMDAGAAAISMTQTIPTQTELSGIYIGSKITYAFKNHSGAADVFTYTVTNDTKATTLASESFNLPNTVSVSDAIFISSDRNDIGDVIKIRWTAGVLGTAGGEIQEGWVSLRVQNFVKIAGVSINPVQYNQVEI